MYAETGSVVKLAERLGCSPTTVKKYLSQVEKDPTPWKLEKVKRQQDDAYLAHAKRSVNNALSTKKFWLDIQNRRIPKEAIDSVYVEFPAKPEPLLTIYGVTKNGVNFVALFKVPPVDHPEPSESTSDA